jgi:hypothetical protein
MTRQLLDVNVLIALAWPNHVHHRAAQAWFGTVRPAWATTPITQCGFVRVSANPRFVPTAVGPGDAVAMLAAMIRTGDHEFLADAVELVVGSGREPTHLTGHQQVTDAHLLAVAEHHGAGLATFDRAVRALADRPQAVTVIAVPGLT